MKFICSLFIIISLILTCHLSNAEGPTSLEKALNPESNPYCLGDCKILKKLQAIFPLKGEEKNIDTQLNFFNWKYFYVFADHLSVYSASQTEPVVRNFQMNFRKNFMN